MRVILHHRQPAAARTPPQPTIRARQPVLRARPAHIRLDVWECHRPSGAELGRSCTSGKSAGCGSGEFSLLGSRQGLNFQNDLTVGSVIGRSGGDVREELVQERERRLRMNGDPGSQGSLPTGLEGRLEIAPHGI